MWWKELDILVSESHIACIFSLLLFELLTILGYLTFLSHKDSLPEFLYLIPLHNLVSPLSLYIYIFFLIIP